MDIQEETVEDGRFQNMIFDISAEDSEGETGKDE